jgi:hypothetical protein
MTYLELVNAVLTRMREDSVLTLAGSDDVIVNMAKDFVNDAKETCEQAHTWTGLASEWTATTSTTSDKVTLTGSSRSAIIEDVFIADGQVLRNVDRSYLRKKALTNPNPGFPTDYVLDSTDASNDIMLRMWPTPETEETITVYGYQSSPRLVLDSDLLKIPAQPVIYLAQAMASRERGEDGSLQASELLGLAKQYLSDAIAQDATNSEPDNVWTTV